MGSRSGRIPCGRRGEDRIPALIQVNGPGHLLPERWLPDAPSRYAADDREFYHPFNVGPRNCLGKNLAWAEMNLIFAKTVLAFDMEWSDRNKEVGDWRDQKTYFINEKKALYVKLIPRPGSEGK